MDGGDLVGALTGAAGVALIGFLREAWRGRRSAKVGDAKVAVAGITAGSEALRLLAAEVEDLREVVRTERDECRREMTELHEERNECRREVASVRAELGAALALIDRLQQQVNRLRSWMRADPDERGDLTPVETPAKKGSHR